MRNNLKIITLFFVASFGSIILFADNDSTCNTGCDQSEFVDSCNSSAAISSTTSVNKDDPTMLPVQPMFTGSDIQSSDNWGNIFTATNTLYSIIQVCSVNHYTINQSPLSPSDFYNNLQSLKGYLLPFNLNDNDDLLIRVFQSWYDNIISKDFILDINQQAFVIQSAAGSVTSSLSSKSFSASDLSQQECILGAQKKCLSDAITCLNAEVSQKNQDLETARQDAFSAFSKSNLFIRGRLGIITNTSSISYQLVDSGGEILDTIAAGKSSSNLFALSDYANSQQGTMFKLVPYDGTDEVVEDGTGEALSFGGTFTILCNSVGMNSSGNPYGYEQSVSVTRVYPSGATRAHVVDVSSVVQDNQYWEFNVTINPLPANTQFVYPRISGISSVTETLDVTTDFPSVLEAEMDSVVVIKQSNSSVNCYPGFDSDDYWSDVQK